MMYILGFLPEVGEDVMIGYTWYAGKASGLGEEFLQMFYAYAGEISRNPLLYPKVYGEFRRCLLRRFPYAVYFRIKGKDVVVFGLFHCARDPHTIRARLHGRSE